MEKEFIPYEQALELKKLGFDEPCFGYFNIDPYLQKPVFNLSKTFEHEWCLPAPTFSQAFRWFDENTEISGFIIPSIKEGHFDWVIRDNDTEEEIQCEEYYVSRLEAEFNLLIKLIAILKNKKSIK